MEKQVIQPKPAILNGNPVSSSGLPFARPTLPAMETVAKPIGEILANGMVTTGPYLQQFEDRVKSHLQVKHAIGVSSCTTGLILAMQAMKLPEDSEVIVPSFTFMASANAPVWNRLRLRFVDIERDTFTISHASVEQTLSTQTSAIIAVPIFGNPVDVPKLKVVVDQNKLRLLFDSAHGFGVLQDGKPIGGNGDAEVFSLSPTKLLIAGEGGIVATNDDAIAEHVRFGRNYGNPGNYDSLFCGMNARMSEFHAICGLQSFPMLEDAAITRNKIVEYYQKRLSQLPGIRFQKILPGNRCSYKDFSIVIDDEFNVSRDVVKKALEAEGISTRVYFSPTLHKMTAYKKFADEDIHERLPNTLWLEERILSLPLYSNMTEDEAAIACEALERIHYHADAIKKHCAS
jgi:dTDP-4-amino-4,6-dideoxygalactose transaminase